MSSLRSRRASQTIAIARTLVAPLGVSEVVDITSLDCLGLPVYVSVRPRGSAVQVHCGRGTTSEDALAGALMEAVEYAAAESVCAVQALPLSRMVRQWPPELGMIDFAPRVGAAIRARARVEVVRCEILQSRRSLLLPAELVLLPSPVHRRGSLIFGRSSNGLASGNTLAEATLHALLEVLERDTVAMHIGRDESRPVVAATLPEPFRGMAETWRGMGIRLFVRLLPNALGLCCFEVGLHQVDAHDPALVLCRGWGVHLDRHAALASAVCEAAQSRLAVILSRQKGIPGAAEMRKRLGAAPTATNTERQVVRLTDNRSRVRFDAAPQEPTPSVPAALRQLIARLPAAGLGPVFRCRLHLDGNPKALRGLHVVKVIVARSETPLGVHPRIGPRLIARLQGG